MQNIIYQGKYSLLDKLSNKQLKSVAKELRLLAICGQKIKLPHMEAIDSEYYLLTERKFGLRIYYTYNEKEEILFWLKDEEINTICENDLSA